MAFDKLETIVSSSRSAMPASVTLSATRGGVRPRCIVALSAALTAEVRIKKGDVFEVLLGTGEQKGLLRLKRSKAGIAAPKFLKQGAACFNLGHIGRFGSEPEPKQYCNAHPIDADTIEVVLPPWSQEQDV